MKKKIYLVHANHKDFTHEEDSSHRGASTERLIEISGREFYQLVSDTEGEQRYFIRLADDMDFACAEILIEVPKTDYLIWKQENNQYLYKRSVKSRYTEVPFDDALLFLSEKRNEALETAPPEEIIEKMENLNQLQKAFAGLTEEEKELIWLLYLCKEPLTETQAASVLHISQSAVHKRKKKILEKMKSFWL